MRASAVLILALFTSTAMAQLPPPTAEEQAKTAEFAAKDAWTKKVGAYQLCLEMDRVAAKYRARLKTTGEAVPPPIGTAPCVDPGPYAPQPLEAAEAHSPADTAVAPPSTKAKAAETQGDPSK